MDPIPLDTAYTWVDARARGATRRQIQADGLEIARGLYISRAVSPTLVRRCRAWTRLLPDDATFGLETAGPSSALPSIHRP